MSMYQRFSPKHGAVTPSSSANNGVACEKSPSRTKPPSISPLAGGESSSSRIRHFSVTPIMAKNIKLAKQILAGNASSQQPESATGSSPRAASLLNGLRSLTHRQRSESLNMQTMRKPTFTRKVQIANCPLDSVYDLREDGEASDLYDDDMAFRRPRSNSSDFLIIRKTSRPLSVDVLGLVDTQEDPYSQYMKVVDCYELAPVRGDVIMLDSQIKAFKVLCEHNIGSGIVWDGTTNSMVSILTMTDFLKYLLSNDSETLMEEPLEKMLGGNQLVTVSSDTKVFKACEEFISNRIHRVVVFDPLMGDVHYLLTIKRVLLAIHKQHRSIHFAAWLSYKMQDLNIGVWGKPLLEIGSDEPVLKAAKILIDNRISSMPVVNKKGEVFEVLHKCDIAQALYNQTNPKEFLSRSTVRDVIPIREPEFFPYHDSTVSNCLDSLLNQKHARCLFIINRETKRPIGCVSLYDIMNFILYGNKNPSPGLFVTAEDDDSVPSSLDTPTSMDSSEPLDIPA